MQNERAVAGGVSIACWRTWVLLGAASICPPQSNLSAPTLVVRLAHGGVYLLHLGVQREVVGCKKQRGGRQSGRGQLGEGMAPAGRKLIKQLEMQHSAAATQAAKLQPQTGTSRGWKHESRPCNAPASSRSPCSALFTTPTPPSGLMARFSGLSVCRPTITCGQLGGGKNEGGPGG